MLKDLSSYPKIEILVLAEAVREDNTLTQKLNNVINFALTEHILLLKAMNIQEEIGTRRKQSAQSAHLAEPRSKFMI
jgi:hypothetical protein